MTHPTPNPADPNSRPDTSPTPGPTPCLKPGRVKPGPPTKHQLALMIWLAVFPTLTVLNLVLGDWLGTLNAVTRTFVLATIAVPIVIYGLMPQLHRLRAQFDFGGSTPGDQPDVGRTVARGSSHRAAGSSRASSTSDANRRDSGLDD
jgi:hypothetical protein